MATDDQSGLLIKKHKGNPVINPRNPMLVDVVIRCVLKYLDFNEIKNTRLISKVWSSAGLSLIKPRSKITFRHNNDSKQSSQTLSNFFSTFQDDNMEVSFFTTYCFDSSETWAVEDLNNFFQIQKQYIRELHFNVQRLEDKNSQGLDKYDIGSWLDNSGMTKLNAKYHTKLMVYANDTCYSIPLNVLVNIKELGIFQGTGNEIHLQDGIVISPICISLTNVCFYKNGCKLIEICLNDIVDMSNTKSISLREGGGFWSENMTNIKLDMGRNAGQKFDKVVLFKVEMENVENCQWEINILDVTCTPLTVRSPMKVKNICIAYSRTDISVLPLSIESLTICKASDQNNFCICSQPIVFHNLKALRLFIPSSDFDTNFRWSIFGFFKHQRIKCPCLEELHIYNNDQVTEIMLSWIPQSVKTIKIEAVNLRGLPLILNLDKLVLVNYAADEMLDAIGTDILTNTLILSVRDRMYNVNDLANFLIEQHVCRGVNKKVYVGYIHWEKHPDNSFDESILKTLVDKKSKFYVFENQMGKAIESEEFVSIEKQDFNED